MTTRFLIYLLLLFIGVLIGIVRYRSLTIPFKFLFVFISYTFCSEATSRFLIPYLKSSFPVYHFYVILSTTILMLIYFSLFSDKVVKISIAIVNTLFIIYSSINSIFFQKLFSFPSNSIIVSDIIMIVFSLLLFRYFLHDSQMGKNRILIFFNSIILFYFVIQIFNWGLYNYMIKNNYNTKIISDFGYSVNLLYYGCLNIILLRVRKDQS